MGRPPIRHPQDDQFHEYDDFRTGKFQIMPRHICSGVCEQDLVTLPACSWHPRKSVAQKSLPVDDSPPMVVMSQSPFDPS